MEHSKFCCDGLNAVLIEPLFPVYRDVKGQKVKFYTAVYMCRKCKSLSVRGETNQLRSWNTFIEWITEDKVKTLVEERKAYELAQRAHDTVPAAQD
jgi:uncharacterized Fe-S cluster protein YjdI